MTLILASASPRRSEFLARAGVSFRSCPADVDERLHPGEAPECYAERVANDKAQHVAKQHAGDWVLSADTIVVIDGEVLGKPRDETHAKAMLRGLSGRTHRVITAVTLVGAAPRCFRVETEVDVRALDEGEIASYLKSCEWQGKAGGYAVQGIAAAFITAIRGSYTNVVGLPLAEVLLVLRETGAATANFAAGQPV